MARPLRSCEGLLKKRLEKFKKWLDCLVAARVCEKKASKNQKMARPFRSCEGLLKKGFKKSKIGSTAS